MGVPLWWQMARMAETCSVVCGLSRSGALAMAAAPPLHQIGRDLILVFAEAVRSGCILQPVDDVVHVNGVPVIWQPRRG